MPVLWPSADIVFFDCDSTLTRVEGIDELARLKGVGDEIAELTRQAMDGVRDLESVYARRLELLQPTRGELAAIAEIYREQVVEDARAVIAALQALDIQVVVISGGLAEPVQRFAQWLGVAGEAVRTVQVEFDQLAGRWWESWEHQHAGNHAERFLALPATPLALSQGKADVVRAVLGERRQARTLLVGDGASDLAARAMVDLFVGYGGVVARPVVAAGADVFIPGESLAPLVALAGGPRAARLLAGTEHAAVFEKGFTQILENQVKFRDDARRVKLLDSLSDFMKEVAVGPR